MVLKYNTDELKKYIHEIYAKLKSLAEKDKVYEPLNIHFADEMPQGYDGTYCYADKNNYHYRYVERGVVQQHYKTQSLVEITYWVLEPQIFSMSVEYERKHRINNQDSRRIIFKKEFQFFEILGGEYKKRAELEINEILKKHPFHDKH